MRNANIRYTWKDLQQKANDAMSDQGWNLIGKTQFFKDIKALKAPPFNAPIETYKENGQSYYRYSDPNFSLQKKELNELEAEKLKSAVLVLNRFKGLPQFEWVQEVIPKIEKNFGFKGEIDREVIGFDENVDLQGLQYLGPLFNYIINKKTLRITYKPFSVREPLLYVISPYYLKQYNKRWFLFGKDERYPTLSLFPLDRIVAMEDTNLAYQEEQNIDFEEYFEDLVGVTRRPEDKSEEVILWFSENQIHYIETKPIHGTQKIRASEDSIGYLVSINVIINYELESLILSYGENCRVVSPMKLKRKIGARIKLSYLKYEKDGE